MHFLDVLQKSDIMLLTMGKNMEGGGGRGGGGEHFQSMTDLERQKKIDRYCMARCKWMKL